MSLANGNDTPRVGQVLSWRASCAFLGVLALLAVLYGWIIYLSSVGDVWWELDVVNSFRMWGVDDSYRYYLIRDILNFPNYFSWSYTLPVQLVFDGSLSALLGQNIAALRAVHGAIYLLSLYVLTRSLMKLTRHWQLALSAMLLLGLIPFCLFVSISFYAESYMVVLVVLMLAAQINQRDNLLLVLASVSPLTRPEGIFFLAAVGLYFLAQKDFKRVLLVGFPITMYFLWMLATSGWDQFVEWRAHFVQVQLITRETVPALQDAGNIWRMFGMLFLAPVFLSPLNKKIHPLWPLVLATVLWFLFWARNILVGEGNYEARYFVPLVPVLVVMWVAGVDFLASLLSRFTRKYVSVVACGLLFIITLYSFVVQQTHIQFYVKLLFTEEALPLAALAQLPVKTSPDFLKGRQGLMEAIYHGVSEDNPYQVDRLLLSTSFARLFYYLDPRKVPPDVEVGFAPTRSHDLIYKQPTKIFAMFGGERQRYAYFDFFPPELGGPLAVFVGNIEYVAPIRIYGDVPLYLFRYESFQ